MSNFLGFALAEAKKTRFEVQTLGGLKQYVAAYFQHHDAKRTAAAAAQTREIRERDEAERAAYSEYRRRSALALFGKLSPAEQTVVEKSRN